MSKTKVLVKIKGNCNVNPNGEMIVKYLIDGLENNSVTYFDIIESKYGNTLLKAEYTALNMALERLLELNMTATDIELQTVSYMIFMHSKGYMCPNNGHYKDEAFKAKKLMNRFTNLKIEQVDKFDLTDLDNIKN